MRLLYVSVTRWGRQLQLGLRELWRHGGSVTPKQVESLREGLRRNVRMGCELDTAQETADALLALLRRDWANRVLDTWTKGNGSAGRGVQLTTGWSAALAAAFKHLDQGDARIQFQENGEPTKACWGPDPDAARHAAALVAWPQLTHEQCQEIGPCP
jgi:hypothetical protein